MKSRHLKAVLLPFLHCAISISLSVIICRNSVLVLIMNADYIQLTTGKKSRIITQVLVYHYFEVIIKERQTEILESRFWWLLVLIMIVFIFAYKELTKNPDAISSEYEANKKMNGNPIDNLKFIEEVLKNSGFKKIGFNTFENRFFAQINFSKASFSEYHDFTSITSFVCIELQ